ANILLGKTFISIFCMHLVNASVMLATRIDPEVHSLGIMSSGYGILSQALGCESRRWTKD
ncbi:MAG: hypothetical protein KF890_12805, partial [Nitrospira sp.]|nr:hypothetical protein [Nitrospira sp.]